MADISITCTKHGNCVIEATTDVGKKFLKDNASRLQQGDLLLVQRQYLRTWLEIFEANEISYEGL
jgi:hypothetical protein